jgi:predicted lysophospholipase L1 biosynthesis ABC-type transport system permease subunit
VKSWSIGLRLLRRDWRSGELSLLGAALVLAVAAITAVGFFTDRIERAMERQGSELIAADLVLVGSHLERPNIPTFGRISYPRNEPTFLCFVTRGNAS